MLQDNPFSSRKRQEVEFSETEDDTDDDEIKVVEPAAGWAYVGSHNFTPSAWGTLSGSSFNPILNVRHLFFCSLWCIVSPILCDRSPIMKSV
jgi:tyrosyl-DNA phosphodiesterase 1